MRKKQAKKSADSTTVIAAGDFFLALEALLTTRKAALRKRVVCGFAVVDVGPYTVDTGAPRMVSEGACEEPDVVVICNERTLSDMLQGHFDPEHPGKEHLFTWSGDPQVWKVLGMALAGGKSALGAHLEALRR